MNTIIKNSKFIDRYYNKFNIKYDSIKQCNNVNIIYTDIYKVQLLTGSEKYHFVEKSKTFLTPLLDDFKIDLKYFNYNFDNAIEITNHNRVQYFDAMKNGLKELSDFYYIDNDDLYLYKNLLYILVESTIKQRIYNSIVSSLDVGFYSSSYYFYTNELLYLEDIKQMIRDKYNVKITEDYTDNCIILKISK